MKQENKKQLDGQQAFELYDTYGFPLDLTRDRLAEEGLEVDEEGFKEAMKEQRRRARQARTEGGFAGGEVEVYEEILEDMREKPEFVGYNKLQETSEVKAVIKDGEKVESLSSGEEGEVVLATTPFYAESGGQIGDSGLIFKENELNVKVKDVKDFIGMPVHQIEVEKGNINSGEEVKTEVNEDLRNATARNHTSTHLLHQVLMDVLGDHVNQSGSLVSPERLRFDFTHFDKLSEEEIKEIEDRVNLQILKNRDVKAKITSVEEAKEMGAQALFEEEYGEEVRVIEVDDFSLELCGGTHVTATGDIGLFKIVNESSIAAGVRRIEAVTGMKALNYLRDKEKRVETISDKLNTNPDKIAERIDQLLAEKKDLEKEISSLQDRIAAKKAKELLNQQENINGVPVIISNVKGASQETIRSLSDELMEKVDSGIIILASTGEEKVYLVARVSSDLIEKGYKAGDLVGEIAQEVGGGGGGRPDMAQAGGSQPENLDRAFSKAREIINHDD